MNESDLAKDGSAIIDGKVVRKGGVGVLRALFELKKAVTVPEIARHLNDNPSVQSLYTVLKRLHDSQGFVEREERSVTITGTTFRRVVWKLTKPAKKFFASLDET
jgi:predicted transcriptional regulator